MSNNSVPAVPNLPLPSVEYRAQYMNALTNVLRLYFNPLTSSVQTNTNDISSLTTLYWLGL